MFTYMDESTKSIWNELVRELQRELRTMNVLRDGQGKTFIRYEGDPRKYRVIRGAK